MPISTSMSMPISNAVLARSIRVFLVAQPLVRWGLERLVQTASPGCQLVGSAASLDESVPVLRREGADVVVLVLDSIHTEDLAGFCTKAQARALLVTDSRDHAWLDSVVLAGVRGVVHTADAPEALLRAIEKVHGGELWVDRSAMSRLFVEMARHKAAQRDDPDHSKIATLTMRERQTIAAVTSDAAAPGKVIAERLCISEHTLRNHLTSIYSKLGLSNRVDLYAYATRHQLHEPR
jgi:two-component system, NarL family, nitrate/nitrite response regulator NarL